VARNNSELCKGVVKVLLRTLSAKDDALCGYLENIPTPAQVVVVVQLKMRCKRAKFPSRIQTVLRVVERAAAAAL
jgi:hypothetical protein